MGKFEKSVISPFCESSPSTTANKISDCDIPEHYIYCLHRLRPLIQNIPKSLIPNFIFDDFSSYWSDSGQSESDFHCLLLPSATKLRKGNVFTPVCQSFCSQGGCIPACIGALGQTPPPPGRYPNVSQHALGQTLPCVSQHALGQTLPRVSQHALGQTPTPPHPTPDDHCSGRYTSYWNAFLFLFDFTMW